MGRLNTIITPISARPTSTSARSPLATARTATGKARVVEIIDTRSRSDLRARLVCTAGAGGLHQYPDLRILIPISHMVCEGGRPCGRWCVPSLRMSDASLTEYSIKRDIANLCRDVTPPSAHRRESTHPRSTASPSHPTVTEPVSPSRRLSELDPSLYADANFPPSWPLLPDSGSAPRETYVDGTGGQAGEGAINRGGQWGMGDDTELGALS